MYTHIYIYMCVCVHVCGAVYVPYYIRAPYNMCQILRLVVLYVLATGGPLFIGRST
jgi:hypothetical protein